MDGSSVASQVSGPCSSSGRLNEEAGPTPIKVSKRRKTPAWLVNAAEAISNLANSAQVIDDEWSDFGKDVANTIRGLESKALRRQTKFAVQQALFNVSDPDYGNILHSSPSPLASPQRHQYTTLLKTEASHDGQLSAEFQYTGQFLTTIISTYTRQLSTNEWLAVKTGQCL